MMMSNSLKELASQYNVFLMTASQLSGDYNKKCFRDARYLRGSKALADKLDFGAIGLRVPQEELEAIKPYCESAHLPLPNLVIDIYKNRRGKMNEVKIFKLFNYGTCHSTDILVTDANWSIQPDVPELRVQVSEKSLADYVRN